MGSAMKRGRKFGAVGPYKVTIERRHELMQIYLHMGGVIAGEECIASGVHPYYAANQCFVEGLRRNSYKRKADSKRVIRLWERASKVGKVCI